MVWQIKWSKTAEKQISKIDIKNAQRIVTRLEEIADDPYAHTEKLAGFDLRKLRVGNYRVILGIEGQKMIIFVVEVGHRSKIYKNY
ncbi:MAG: type II toxin-antitoxin system RelE/ParE family toxin [Thaumarchaeota archaeon]|nr:type II toxin-antitoxin system RelE/ParE family toxin [Nitrososphaerota archaeon]